MLYTNQNYCYLIRVEHTKCSEMYVWIVRFGKNLRKWVPLPISTGVSKNSENLPGNYFGYGPSEKKHERPKFEHRFFGIGPVSQIVPLNKIKV